MICNATENNSRPCLRINAVELASFDERVGDGRRSAAVVRAYEQVIFTFDSYASHAAFGSIVVDTQATIVEIRPQPFEMG